jgi:hypothetical protein
MKKPLITIDGQTREMNADEFEQYKLDQAEADAQKAKEEAKVAARAQLLERLGITAEEAQLLLS